jgi:protein gp37
MGDKTGIEWTEATWNPLTGCEAVSPGCDHCYAARQASGRLSHTPAYEGLASGGKFNGTIRLLPDRLSQPLRWKRPRRIFVNSMSDLFHKDVPDHFIAQVFAVMARAPQHTFQLLTKRHARMRSLLNDPAWVWAMRVEAIALGFNPDGVELNLEDVAWPLPNLWGGVSVEDQHWAAIRIPALIETPFAVRWLSCEPLLAPVSIDRYLWLTGPSTAGPFRDYAGRKRGGGGIGGQMIRSVPARDLHWVVAGGESGPAARPMHPDWARSLREQCREAQVPFLFKQWGEWGPAAWRVERGASESITDYKARAEDQGATHSLPVWAADYGMEPLEAAHKPWSVERQHLADDAQAPLRRWGKRAAGRELDGRTWDEYPDSREAVPA